MGKNSAPSYNAPAPPKLMTADELFSSGNNFAKTNFPTAYGAREGALADLNNPNYYAGFQPTSFEQALGNQYFKNVWPDTEAYTADVLSKSGMAYSPVAAATLGKRYGDLSTQIGQYLSDLGNTRATNSLSARLGIDPMSLISPYVDVGMTQSNNQANLDYDYQKQLAQIAYQQALQKYQQQKGMASLFSKIGGTGLGALLALPTGGMSVLAGAALGGLGGDLAAPMFGGNAASPEAIGGDLLGFALSGGFGSPVNPASAARSVAKSNFTSAIKNSIRGF